MAGPVLTRLTKLPLLGDSGVHDLVLESLQRRLQMGAIQDMQAVLIDALLREATPEQASQAMAELVRRGPLLVVTDDDDEAAAAWLVDLAARIECLCEHSSA